MTVTAALLIGLPGRSRDVYGEPGVLELAVLLLPIAGVFQVFDGLQVVALGLLRGLGDTRVPMLINVLGLLGLRHPCQLVARFRRRIGRRRPVVGARARARDRRGVTLVVRLRTGSGATRAHRHRRAGGAGRDLCATRSE
jgi:hypothetical protein